MVSIPDSETIIGQNVHGKRALDFGCGAGRSTRFLRELGFEVVGIDISEPMITRAREREPHGDYRLIVDGDLGSLVPNTYDLIFWTDEAYRDVYRRAGVTPIKVYRPLGDHRDPYSWVSETRIAPWVIYVLKRAE